GGQSGAVPPGAPAAPPRRSAGRNTPFLFAHNLPEPPKGASSPPRLPRHEGRLLVNLLSENHSRATEDGHHHMLMEPYGYRWFRVGGLDYLLKRSDIETEARG